VFEGRRAGAGLNIEIERSTQVMVDAVGDAVAEQLGPLKPLLDQWLAEHGRSLDELAPHVPR